MTRHLLPLVTSLVLCCPLHADIVAESRVFGQKFAVRVPEKAIQDAPKWTQELDNPPLSARKAIEAATTVRKELVRDTDEHEWKFDSMKLMRYEHDLWYWELSFIAEPRGIHTGRPPLLRLVVLMDGLCVKPAVSQLKD
jgi:hypothetical protein